MEVNYFEGRANFIKTWTKVHPWSLVELLMFGMCSSCLVHQQITSHSTQGNSNMISLQILPGICYNYLIVWKYLCYHTFQLPSVVFSIFIFIHFIHEVLWFRRRFLTYYLTVLVNKNCVLALFLSFPEWFSPPELLIPITLSPPGLISEAKWNVLHEWLDNSVDKGQGRMILLCL